MTLLRVPSDASWDAPGPSEPSASQHTREILSPAIKNKHNTARGEYLSVWKVSLCFLKQLEK